MAKKPKDMAVIGAVSLGVILFLALILEAFTDLPITTYNVFFIVMLPVAFFLILRFFKFARKTEELKLEDALLLIAIAIAVVFFFVKGQDIWPTFSSLPAVKGIASLVGLV